MDFKKLSEGREFALAISKNPLITVILVFAVLSGVFMAYVAPPLLNKQSQFEKEALGATKRIVELTAQIEAMNAQDRAEIRPLLQSIVDAQPVSSWFKYFDVAKGKHLILVVNDVYEKRFGIGSNQSKGKTGFQAYFEQRPDLTDSERVLLLEYQLNDRLAARNRKGCVVVEEWVLPLASPPVKEKVRKCGMESGTILLVYGEMV